MALLTLLPTTDDASQLLMLLNLGAFEVRFVIIGSSCLLCSLVFIAVSSVVVEWAGDSCREVQVGL